jgi:hypothetical protein
MFQIFFFIDDPQFPLKDLYYHFYWLIKWQKSKILEKARVYKKINNVDLGRINDIVNWYTISINESV